MSKSVRRRVLEQLLAEASSNDPRKVSEGSLALSGDGLINWAEKSQRGIVARTGLVHWPTFWDLVDDALTPTDGPSR